MGMKVLFSARKISTSLAASPGKRGLSNPITQLAILDADQKQSQQKEKVTVQRAFEFSTEYSLSPMTFR